MRNRDEKLNEVEQLLRKVRLAQPSEELRAQVVGAAHRTWKTVPADIPWRVPLRHLGLAAAAAVLIVSCANYYCIRTVAPWQAHRAVAARVKTTSFEGMPETPYSPFVRHLIATCDAPARDAAALLDYVQSVRKTLDGTEEDNTAGETGPGGHESRLWKGHDVGGGYAVLDLPRVRPPISPPSRA
jgi:hypothetical protein